MAEDMEQHVDAIFQPEGERSFAGIAFITCLRASPYGTSLEPQRRHPNATYVEETLRVRRLSRSRPSMRMPA